MEAVLFAFVGEALELFLVLGQGGFVGGDTGVYALVVAGVLEHQRCGDLGHLRDGGLATVEWDTGVEVFAESVCERVDHSSAEAEADGSELAFAVGTLLEPKGSRNEILGHLLAVNRAKRSRTFLIVARIAADRGQSVGSEGHVTGLCEAAGNVFDIWIEAAVFVDDEDGSEFFAFGRASEIALDRAVASGRRHRLITDFDILVVLRHGLSPRVIRLQALEDRNGSQTADRELAQAAHKRTPVHISVLVFVKKIQ